jgi:hypothetical protein
VRTCTVEQAGLHLDITKLEHHDVRMRTTLTLDDDVAERLDQEIRRSGQGMKSVVNEALRVAFGLAPSRETPPPFEVRPHTFGFKPGIDLDRMNQLADEMEAEEVARKLQR